MIVILRSVFYALILSVISFSSSIANAASGPPYGNGASVSVPFANAPLPTLTSPQITVGFASPNATDKHPTFPVTMDTGSIGIIVGSDYFTPPAMGILDPSFVGPGIETLTSSGYQITGYWYKSTVNLYNGNTVAASSTVPVMAVTKITCIMGARVCTPGTTIAPESTHYFGIGFAGGPGSPQGTPDKNAFLNVTSIPNTNALPSPGYVLSTQGVQIGLTASNTKDFALIKLQPVLAPDLTQWQTTPASPNVLTDWQHARATITVNRVSASGGILFDTGVTTSFLTPPVGVTVRTGMGPSGAECNTTPPTCAVAGTSIQVSFTSLSNPVASLKYTVGSNNGFQPGNPVSPRAVSVEYNSSPFLNTTVQFLQAFDYFYDAANGFIGLKTTGNTPAQYAASTPSGLALDSVFQCFFSSAGSIFGSPPGNLSGRPTGYNWPYTYRSNRADNTSIAISSGNPASSPTGVNDVFILGANGQATDQGSLSGWLAAAGCQ